MKEMRKTFPLIAALLMGAVIAVVAVTVLNGDDEGDEPRTTAGSTRTDAVIPASLRNGEELVGPGGAFRLRYPKSWKVVNPKATGATGRPLAAVRQSKGQAVLVVQREDGKLAGTRKEIAEGLTQKLKKDIKDFQFVSADEVKLPAGDALTYTFVRAESQQVQNLVVIPNGGTTYTLNSVVAGKADKAATQISDMIKTFDPEK
jgi:hypothetical protein